MKTMQSKLQHDVLAELQWEPSVDSSRIGTMVENGVVVLTGCVHSLAERHAAETAAKRVRGVTAVANELHVDLLPHYVRDDAQLAKAAQDTLHWQVQVPHDHLTVTVSDGWVVLEGHVPFAHQRQAAMLAVANLTGVLGVTNRIQVRAVPAAPDVKRKVTAALHRYASIEAGHIRVEGTNGKLVLRGKVRSWHERDLVQEAAWSAPGVTEVDNCLDVQA